MTKFSVLIPAYKRKYLKEAIDSILLQTYCHFELIIVDDASPEDIKSVIAEYHDDRIRYFRNDKNCGAINVVDNWNICLSYAQGDYVICMGDDDRMLPCCLEEYCNLIEKYPGIGLLHGWTEIIDEDSNVIRLTAHRCEYESAVSLSWHRWNVYTEQYIGDFCFNTSWLKQNGGFYKLPLAWGSDDISAIIGASLNGVANTQKVVFQYRRNRQTISTTGNINIKIKAILEEKKWYTDYLRNEFDNEIDALYSSQMNEILLHYYEKKICNLIAIDIKKSKFRFLWWLIYKKNYHLNMKAIAYALIQSFK